MKKSLIISLLLTFILAGTSILTNAQQSPRTCESFRFKSKKAFNGMCLVIVAAEKGAAGSFKVVAESKGLKAGTVTINCR